MEAERATPMPQQWVNGEQPKVVSHGRRGLSEATHARIDAHLNSLVDAHGRRLISRGTKERVKARLEDAINDHGRYERHLRRMQEGGDDAFDASTTVELALDYATDPPPIGDTQEIVWIDPELGDEVLVDDAGNALPDVPHEAGPLTAPPAGSLGPAGQTVQPGESWGGGVLCDGSNNTMFMGALLNPLVALVHGMLHTSGPLLPYAAAALKLRNEVSLTKAGKMRRATPRWGPYFWFLGVVASMVLLCQVALNVLRIPWTVALAPLWLLEASALAWLMQQNRRCCDRDRDTGQPALSRWLAVVQMCLDFALHLSVAVMADVLAVEGFVVLAVAVPQLLVSLGATNYEAQRRATNPFAPKRAQALLFGSEIVNWVLVITMVILAVVRPNWTLQCVGSWLWALMPFWVTALVLLLHQLWLCFLWRCLRPKAKKTQPLLANEAPSQANNFKQAIGFAIREQLAHGGDLTDAVRLVKSQVEQARKDGMSFAEVSTKIKKEHHQGSPPWIALGEEFEGTYGRPPQTEAELVGFAKALLDETRDMDVRLSQALEHVSLTFTEEFQRRNDGYNPRDAVELHNFAKQLAEVAAQPGGMRLLDQSIQVALAQEYQNVHGEPFGSAQQELQFLNQLVDGIKDPAKLTEPLPPRLMEAFHQQVVAMGRAGGLGEREREEALQLLKTLIAEPGGAAASVVVLQDHSSVPDQPHLPESVRLAVAEEFARQKGFLPRNEAETVSFFKEICAESSVAKSGLSVPPEVMAAANKAYADAHYGATAPDMLSALRTLELTVSQNAETVRTEGLPAQLHQALLANAGATADSRLGPAVDIVATAFTAQFQSINRRPPVDATELLSFVKGQADIATGPSGMAMLDVSLQQTIATEHQNLYGPAQSQTEQLQFLKQVVADLETRESPGALGRLDLLLSQGILPPDVDAAARDAFYAETGRSPQSEAETLTFLKDRMATARQEQTAAVSMLSPLAGAAGVPLQATQAFASSTAGSFGSERDMLALGSAGAGAAAVEELIKSAVVQQESAYAQSAQSTLPPAVALAVRDEFATRFGDSNLSSENEITRFAKSIANDYEHEVRRASAMTERAASPRQSKQLAFASTRQLSGKTLGAMPVLPGPLLPPSRFSLAAAFDTVKDEQAGDATQERVSYRKTGGSADDAGEVSTNKRRSILTCQTSYRGSSGSESTPRETRLTGSGRLSQFGAMTTLHGLGASTRFGQKNSVKFDLTLDGTVERFDEAAVKRKLIKEIDNPNIRPEDIELQIKRGSVIVTATVKTRSSEEAAAVATAVDRVIANPDRAAVMFGMPVTSVELLPTVVSEGPPAGGHDHPLTGQELQQAIVNALNQEEANILSDIPEESEETPESKALRRASYACGLSIPLIATAIVAAVFGGGSNAPEAATIVPLALGGVAAVAMIVMAIYFFKKSRRRQAKVVEKRAELVRSQRTQGGSAKSAGRWQRRKVESSDVDVDAAAQRADIGSASAGTSSQLKAASQLASPGFGADDRVAPRPTALAAPANPFAAPASTFGAPPPMPPRPKHLLSRDVSRGAVGSLADPEQRMQARLGRFGAPGTSPEAGSSAALQFTVTPSSSQKLLPVPHPPTVPRPPPLPSNMDLHNLPAASQRKLPPIQGAP